MRVLPILILLLYSLVATQAGIQNAIPLWPDGAPGALGTNDWDVPTLTPYIPHSINQTGVAIIICPGGGYAALAPYEGNDYAVWLNQYGVTCFVLKYRLGSHGYHYPAQFEDVARAMRWVRVHATDYKINPDCIGIMGSSAGGHLASILLTHFDFGNTNSADPIEQKSSRPDFGILCYAVITMGDFTHQGSKDNLLGKNPSPKLVQLLSNESQVKTNTPPCFIWAVYEDTIVPVENSLMFAESLRKNRVPFALHIYEKGWHGMGLGGKPPFLEHLLPWTDDCLFWLREMKFVK